MKKILAIDIDEVIRSKWLQFDRFYAQEFNEEGIKQPFDTYDLRNHYKFDDTIETINYLNPDLPEDISPTEYMLDKDGNAPVDHMAFRKRDEKLTADQMFNKFLYQDFLVEIFGSAPPLYKGLDLNLREFKLAYESDVEMMIFSAEKNDSISPTLFFLSKLRLSVENIKSKRNKIMFFIPDVGIVPSGAVYEIYFHGTLLKSMGYNVKMMIETSKYVVPDFIEPELTQFEHVAMDSAKLTVSPEDMLVIPEIFTNVMEQTKSLPCIRVVLLQSIDNALRALVPGIDWSSFGITHVITTSKILELFVNEFFVNGRFKIGVYPVSVPDYFQKKTEVKRPVVSVFVRNEADLEKVVKLFYAKFPQFRWITFEPMQTESKPPKFLRRKDFADKLGRNFAAIWLDRLASHAQFPLECMRVGTIPICLKPDITPEYIIKDDKYIENSGIWTSDLYAIPALLSDTLRKFLDDEIPQELYTTMDSIAANYTVDKSKEKLTSIYSEIINDRLTMFENAIQAMQPKVVTPEVQNVDAAVSLTDELLK